MKRTSHALLRINEHWPDVKYIEDAKENLRLEIAQCDITKGRIKDHTKCAIAQNLMRTLPPEKCEAVIVARSVGYIKQGDTAIRYIIPLHAQKELIAFDRGGKFMPGTYELKKPWAGNTLKAIANQGPHPTKQPGSGKKRKPFVHHTSGIRAVIER